MSSSQRLLGSGVVLLAVSGAEAAPEGPQPDEGLHFGGVVAGAWQCGEDRCLSGIPAQPEIGFRIDEANELSVQFGFAAGDGLNVESPFNIPSWGANLESDVADVEGRGTGHLLNAWYRHTVRLQSNGTLGTTVGVIDAVDYLDENAYSNDEYTQFMNAALVNGPNIFLPSFEPGVALAWTGRHWSARGVYMSMQENDAGNRTDYVGAQLGYRVDTPLGEGNYRVLVDGTGKQIPDTTDTSLERCASVLLSFDQQLGGTVGGFILGIRLTAEF